MLERFYLKYIPSSWGWIWILSLFFFNGFFWLYEDYIDIEHKAYWYDVVQSMVWILIAALIIYAEKSFNDNFSVKRYDEVKDIIKDNDIVLIEKENHV